MAQSYCLRTRARRPSGRRRRTGASRALVALTTLAAISPGCKDRSPATTSERTAAPAIAVGSSVPLPGAPPFGAALSERLKNAWEGRKTNYVPRTRHLLPDGSPEYVNRLFLESSPYLLQHAHNPVNWFPWGDEAFETARRLGRPVLLSVGSSTCH
jgi:hypothetical protein